MRTTRFLASLLMAMLPLVASSGFAQDTDVQIQGEYTGEIDLKGRAIKVGVQLIARGENQFEVAAYPGGLPGDGWEPDGRVDRDEKAVLKDGKIVFDRGTDKIVWEDGVIRFLDDGQSSGELTRVDRKSETLGAEPPEGGVVLFDGSSGDNFVMHRGDGEPMVDGLLRQGIASKQKFGGDFTLHIEFKLPLEPTKSGQGRGNSGIYVQGRYEVQMLDSFGLTGEHNECGGIYSVKKPDVNMCYPPESWQTYDIDFTSAKWDGDKKVANARMTVRHNGVSIHDDVEVPKTTTAAPLKESSEPGFIFLQDHGSPVRYRNIWILKK